MRQLALSVPGASAQGAADEAALQCALSWLQL